MSSDAARATTALPPLTHAEQILLRKLRARRGGDVAIQVLFCATFGVEHRDVPVPRMQQQRLGAVISTLNRKLAAAGGRVERVVPGKGRRTYRLDRAAALETTSAAG